MRTTIITLVAVAVTAGTALVVYLDTASTASAQPPTTTRVLNASPQGEWVALMIGGSGESYNIGYAYDRVAEKKYHYVMMMHTGTGKVRMVQWEDNPAGNASFQVHDTP